MSTRSAFRAFRTVALAGVVLACLPGGVFAQAPADSSATGVIDTEAAWGRVARARDAAAADRHHESVADYLEALSHDARLVPVVAQEIAYQKLWREDAEKSIFYFRRYLARHPDDPDRGVRKGLALAYSWSGRQDEAVAMYRALATEDPSDGGARVGLARSLIWDNRLGEGWRGLRTVEDEFGADTAAGRESRDFALVVLDSYTPMLEVRADASWDSDDLDIARLSGTASFTVAGNKLLQVLPAVSRYRQPGQPDILATSLGAGLHTALARNWALHAFARVHRFGSDGPLFAGTEDLDWTFFAPDGWLTWIAAPRLRMDFGAGRQAVETFIALDQQIHLTQANASADWRLGRRVTAGVGGQWADYSDGNTRSRGTARLTWKREGRWEIHAGPVVTYMDFANPYPGGYWAPAWVRNGSLEATVKTRTGRWTWRLNGSLGLEKERGSDAVTVGGLSLRAGWRWHEDWLLAAEGGHSRSSFGTASGFNRTFASLSLRAFH